MFDPTTEALIAAAPPLRPAPEGSVREVNPQQLGRELSAAFAELAAIRLKQRGITELDASDSISGDADLRRLFRIANTYEARVVVADGEVDRAAAFVSAICRQIIFDHTELSPDQISRSRLSSAAISSDIIAALLFVASEAHADANSSSSRISLQQARTVHADLAFLIQSTCQARFPAIVEWEESVGLSYVDDEDSDDYDLYETAADCLYRHLSEGLIIFAREMIGQTEIGSAEAVFRNVQGKAAAVQDLEFFGASNLVFPGPHHLARLLIAATSGLGELALVRTRPPAGLIGDSKEHGDKESWYDCLRVLAQRRPLLWRNHRGAIEGGLLDSGTSAVMNFPTGAGKTTLASLKIIAAHLTKGATIYLAPDQPPLKWSALWYGF